MSTKENARIAVREILNRLRNLLSNSPSKKLSESDTKANFIDPLLAALGFAGISDITREYYIRSSKDFIDYMLYVDDTPAIAIEAKQLQHDLNQNDAAQLIQYASVEGIEWCALTNGRRIQLFNQFLKAPLDGKQIADFDLLAFNTDAEFDALFDDLWLLSKERMASPSEIKSWMNQRRLDTAIRSILIEQDSAAVFAIQRDLRNADIHVNSEVIVQWLRSRLLAPVSIAMPTMNEAAPVQHRFQDVNVRKRLPAQGTTQYWLFPASPIKRDKREGGNIASEESLRNWLSHSMWGLRANAGGRKAVEAGDRACFYASGTGFIAIAKITGSASTLISPSEWPESTPQSEDIFKVPLRDVRWFTTPVRLIDKGVRSQLRAFIGKDLDKPWSWYVQRSWKIVKEDYETICLLGGITETS